MQLVGGDGGGSFGGLRAPDSPVARAKLAGWNFAAAKIRLNIHARARALTNTQALT